MEPVITIRDFLQLSALVNYQLSADPVSWRAVLALVLGEAVPRKTEDVLVDFLTYLNEAYGQTKRRLGPYAVLHPIRTAALLGMATDKPNVLDILTTLLHDKNEDITSDRYDGQEWKALEQHYASLLRRIGDTDGWYLNERVDILARRGDEKYYTYLGRVLDRAAQTPEVVRAKLADRLDNTLDMRIDLQEEADKTDCFELIFDILFAGTYSGYGKEYRHPVPGKINGAKRLYQLFKNAVFLSLLRQRKLDRIDEPVTRLFTTLAQASLKESQRILVHLFSHHLRDIREQRGLLIDVMDYCARGAINCVTQPGETHRLDGLFKSRFDHEDKKQLNANLEDLYKDKALMVEAAIAFAAVFSSFLGDPDFRIKGIDVDGIRPTGNP
ncbi:MAG: HD domain-containing protein [Deltaproteobacteria bacterium]|nr:HD domain-containing protein [Deltaproteobacteria bacterium]